jgi:serine/threonine protein kinase
MRSTARRPDSLAPTVTIPLGRARLVDVMGQGATAVVYAATIDQVPLAVKVLRPAMAEDADAVARFQWEIEIVDGLCHPGIPACYGFGRTSDGLPFAAFQRVTGETLRQKMARGQRLSVSAALRALRGILEVLELTHHAGILHRDIKPSNIMLSPEGLPYVLDFGLIQSIDAENDLRRTGGDGIVGTPAYMAPEMARGERDAFGPATDLFCLALTIASGLAGRPLRGATAKIDLLVAAQQPIGTLRTYGLSLPAPLEDLLERALSHEIHGRFRNATHMLDALRFAEEELGEGPVSGRISRESTRRVDVDGPPPVRRVTASISDEGSTASVNPPAHRETMPPRDGDVEPINANLATGGTARFAGSLPLFLLALAVGFGLFALLLPFR